MNDFLLALVGILIGGAIAALVSRYYYQRASEDLREAAERLRQHTTLIANALEAGPPIEFVKDEQTGELVGNVYTGDAVVRLLFLEAERQRREQGDSPGASE
jgi:acyl-CoA synthetase (AMP-forming)/AMP-acid ligase II